MAAMSISKAFPIEWLPDGPAYLSAVGETDRPTGCWRPSRLTELTNRLIEIGHAAASKAF